MTAMISESRFYMWRAVFAMAHADRVVTGEERAFLYKVLADNPFTEVQRSMLESDIEHAQDIGSMFRKITSQDDRSKFFQYARALVWCDGDFGEQEQQIMVSLKKAHLDTADIETIADTMQLQLDDDDKQEVFGMRQDIMASRRPLWKRLLGIP